jgi:hypothetical protein
MNHQDDRISDLDDRCFDLLVDGELSEPERRDLLSSLDREPSLWRRCALAFLEAQSWKRAIGDEESQDQIAGSLPVPADQGHAQPASRRATSDRKPWFHEHLNTLLAMAASFLLALFVGMKVEQIRFGGTAIPGDLTVAAKTESNPAPTAQITPKAFIAQHKPSADAVPGPWQTVTLSLPDGPEGGSRSVDLPAYEQTNLDDDWLRSVASPALPPEVIQALQLRGYQLRQQQAIVPFEMNDGRRLVVPVDQVEVTYVGNPTY